jgi:nucleotide-binding universal stress UspA family protein
MWTSFTVLSEHAGDREESQQFGVGYSTNTLLRNKTMISDLKPVSLPAKLQRVLLCVDPSTASERAARYVCQLGLADLSVRIVGVIENPRVYLPAHSTGGLNVTAIYEELERETRGALESIRQIFQNHGIAVETQVTDFAARGGDIAHALAAEAEDWNADLLVLGARQHHGLLRWVEGVVSESTAKLVRCPVLIVPASYEPTSSSGLKKILFAIDGSPASHDALLTGITLAATGAHLKAVFVVDRVVRFLDVVPIDMREETLVAEVAEGKAAIAKATQVLSSLTAFQTETGYLRTDLVNDDIAHTIVREAKRWPADLIVMGTHGRRGVARWVLGTVASRVAKITSTPLLLVRAFEAQSWPDASRSGEHT